MKRFDFFQPIHNAIRVQLYETCALLQRTDFGAPAEAGAAIDSMQKVIGLLESYHAMGVQYILPAVTALEPAIADSFLQEDAEAVKMRENLQVIIDAFCHETQYSKQDWYADDLVTCFETLALFTIQHLRREENLASKLLWRYYSDVELQSIAAKMASQATVASPPTSGKSIVSDIAEPAKVKGEERLTTNQNVFQAMAATATSAIYPQHRSLLQDVLAGGMVG